MENQDNNITTQPIQTPVTEVIAPAPLAVPPAQEAPVAPHNPLLDRIRLPGETFTLPSGGVFYKKGELSPTVKNGEVHVFPMTGIDEIVIKTPDLLFSGKGVEEVFGRCIPDILLPTKLLSKDVDFLLICLRRVTYGDILEMNYTHTCKNAKEHQYNISISNFINHAKSIDPSSMSSFSVDFDNGQVIKLRPINFENFINIMQINMSATEGNAVEEAKKLMFDSLMSIIEQVDEITEPDFIRQWLEKISASYIKKLSKSIAETTDWGPSFESIEKCKDCGKHITIVAPLNPIAFFT